MDWATLAGAGVLGVFVFSGLVVAAFRLAPWRTVEVCQITHRGLDSKLQSLTAALDRHSEYTEKLGDEVGQLRVCVARLDAKLGNGLG